MYKPTSAGILLAVLLCLCALPLRAQDKKTWTLRDCIDYAQQHNIQIKTKEITHETAEVSLEQAKGAQLPTLSFSSNFGANFQNVTTYNEYMEKNGNTTLSNSFGLNSGLTLYQGGRLRNTVKQQQYQAEAAGYDVEQQRIDLEISIGQENDFNVRSQQEMMETLSSVMDMLTMLLAAVAGISLVVGGIGIMNIMYVSVTERTREIGLRMSIGAKGRQIMLQFLIESIIISVAGGVIGVILCIGASKVISLFGTNTAVSTFSIVLSFLVCVFTGVFFGWYPARKASNLNPIDALRYE